MNTGDNGREGRQPVVDPTPIPTDKFQSKEKSSWKTLREQPPGKLTKPHCKGVRPATREKTLAVPVESAAVAKAAEGDGGDNCADPPMKMSRTKTNNGRRDVAESSSSKICKTNLMDGNTKMEGGSTELDFTDMGGTDAAKLDEIRKTAVGKAETLLGKSEDTGKRKREVLEERIDEEKAKQNEELSWLMRILTKIVGSRAAPMKLHKCKF